MDDKSILGRRQPTKAALRKQDQNKPTQRQGASANEVDANTKPKTDQEGLVRDMAVSLPQENGGKPTTSRSIVTTRK